MVVQQGEKAQHQLNGAVGDAQGQNAPEVLQVEGEAPEAQVGLAREEVGQKEDQAAQLGQARGQGGAEDAPVPDHDEQIVQAHVDEEAHAHAEHGQLGRAVHLHHDLQTVGEDEADGEETDHMEILGTVAHCLGPGPQEVSQRLGEQGYRHGDDGGDDHNGHHRLGKNFLRLFVLPPAQGKGAQGGGAHGQEDGCAGENVDEGQRDIHTSQRQLAHPFGDKDAVNDGIGREENHGGHRGDDVVQKGFPGTAGDGWG